MTSDAEFDAWYQDCRDRLVVQVAALCGDRVEAMDFVQEAFVRAWSRWSRVGSLDDREAWVRRVAVNLAISRWRRARRVVLRASVADDMAAPDHHAAADQQATVLAALSRLPMNQRTAIVLHYLADLPIDVVAHEMSAPVGTVKSWLSRGRAHLTGVLSADLATAPETSVQAAIEVGEELRHGR